MSALFIYFLLFLFLLKDIKCRSKAVGAIVPFKSALLLLFLLIDVVTITLSEKETITEVDLCYSCLK